MKSVKNLEIAGRNRMRKFTVAAVICMGVLLFGGANTFGQMCINAIVDSISNDKLKFEVSKVGITRFVDSSRVTVPKYMVFVDSFPVGADKKLIKFLIPLLKDPNKDRYANVLLYQLTKKDGYSLIAVENRASWFATIREIDLKYWNEYLKNLVEAE